MKKFISKIFVLLMVVLSGLSLTACNEGDDLTTDQYGNEIALNSFGPCPVLRGGTLYFYGSNLDQVTEIDLPGADPITSINVVASGTHSQISIQVPAEKCDTGLVTLVTAKGGKITTVTPVTYREDITLSEFYVGTEGTLVGNVGDVVTVKGDYLNLLHGIVFAENDTVTEDQFITHDRYTIQVAIPEGARTGKLTLTDLATSPTEIQTDDVLEVNLPTVSGITPETPKAGQTITVSGTGLTQIASVKLNGATVGDSTFISQGAQTLSFALPDEATDGEVTLITKSGVSIPAGTITTVVPSNLSAAPSPVKNGDEISISGSDLDLVTGIAFPNAAGELKSVSATKVVAVVPETAQEGDITLSLANGKTVTVAYTLVKPTVTSCTPTSLIAGNTVIIKGTNLDLVSSVTFPGETAQTVSEFSAQNALAIALTVPAAASGTGFTLNLKNGSTVEIASGLTIQAATDPSVGAINPASATAGSTITISGKNFDKVENVYIGSYKVTKYSTRTSTEIVCQVPATAEAGTYKLSLEGFDGTVYDGGTFEVASAELDIRACCVNQSDRSVVMSFPLNISWDDSGRFRIQNNLQPSLKDLKLTAGTSKVVFYKSGTGQIQFNDPNWSSLITVADWNGTESSLEIVLTQDMIDWITGTKTDGWSNTCFIVQGDGLTISKVTIIP
ncbi:MAG: IPT/TIG domain-containing protein [Prevotella sp.]|nr:IPT/TIG domain-containing protein [Prevotella sp.]